MATARGQHAAVAANNKIYVWGGFTGNGGEFNSLEIYDVTANSWSAGADYPTNTRGQASALGDNNTIYSISGYSSGVVSGSYKYTPSTNTWSVLASIPSPVWEAGAAAAPNGKIYVFGGEGALTSTQIYDPATNTWSLGADLPVTCQGHGAVLDANGLFHIIGGSDGNSAVNTHLVYNPVTNTWTTAAVLPIGINQAGVTLGSDGNIYVVGGKLSHYNNNGAFYNSVYVYHPTTNTWTTGVNLPVSRGETRAVTVGSSIFSIGGTDGTYQNTIYSFNLAPGNALALDGNGYTEHGTAINNLFNGTNKLTLEMWVKRAGDMSYSNIIGNYGSSGIANSQYMIRIENNVPHFWVFTGAGGQGAITTDALPLNTWVHLACTWDGATMNMYYNGVLQGTSALTGSFGPSNDPYRIGASYLSQGKLIGSLDEVRVFNTVRSPANIQADMLVPIDPATTGLQAYFNYDQGVPGGNNTGITTLTDLTANHYDGAFSGVTLTGNTSNFVESYAMVVPTATAATSLSSSGFTTNWTTPVTGVVDNGYFLDVSTNATFTAPVSGSPFALSANSKSVSGLSPNTTYYFRARADKVSVTGTGALSNTITVTTLYPTPTTQATNVTFTNTTSTSTTASWTNGNGTSRAVFIAAATTGSPAPVDLTAYTANANYASGTQIGTSGWYCVYNGTGTTVNITGLTTGTTYRVMAVEYNGVASNVAYLITTGTGNPANLSVIQTTGALSALTTTYSTASASSFFNVSGSDLKAGVLVTPPAGFEVSSDNTTFTNTVTIGAAGTLASTPVYIRLKATDAVGSYSGDVVLTSTGAAPINVATVLSNMNKAPLTIKGDNQTKIYGAANPTLSVTYNGFVNGETSANLTTQPTISTTASLNSAVGSYPITATGAASSNYSISYTAGTLTIGKAALFITADNQSKTYGSVNPTFTASYSGFVGTDNAASLTTAPTLTTAAVTSSPVATYPITASGAVSPNYTITYTAGTLTIGKAALFIAADNQSKTYGSVNPTFTASYSGFVGTDNAASLTTAPTLTTAAVTSSPVATYPITASGAASSNYTITYTAGTLTIGKAALFITADNQSKTYGLVNPTFTASYSGFVGTDNAASLTTAPTLTTAAVTGSPVATYPITASGAVSSNYTITYIAGSLTITPAGLTITASNATKTYGAVLPTLAVTYSGFVNGETSGVLTTQPAITTTGTAASSVGTYPITATGAVASNYTITYTAGTLTVTPAGLNITAVNQTKTYGAANPTLTATYSGFVNGDTNSSLTTQPTITTTAVTGSQVNTYPITATGAASSNYTISYTTGTLTVTKAGLNITAVNQTKVYGAANPTLAVTYSGFVNSDDATKLTTQPTIATTATASSAVGTYPITATGAASANYSISYTAATLTVTQAPLVITANNISRNYGQPNPTLTVTYTGLVNGDTNNSLSTQPTITTTATITSLPGTYPITASGAVGPNYSISYVAGTFRVIPLTNANLSNLTISNGILSPTFATGTFSYTTSVANSVSNVTVIPTADPTATVLVNGLPATNGGPFAVDLSVGNNTITVLVTAQDGTTKLTYTITLYRAVPPDAVFATNILTPNGDGKNDNWIIKDILLYPNNTVKVFDRAGRIVFAQHSYANTWDGTLSGSPLTEGTYYYAIDLGIFGAQPIKGYISILRKR
nr:MBG domain-containing protein [Mucilaginibacter gracilis]